MNFKEEDLKLSFNQAIGYIQDFPCTICRYGNGSSVCDKGVRYVGTCQLYRALKIELFRLRKKE